MNIFTSIILNNDKYLLTATVLNIIIVQGTNLLLLSYYQRFCILFTGITAVAYVLVGNIVSLIIYIWSQLSLRLYN